MARLSGIDWLALVLILVGALNWGLVGVLGLDLVALIFGAGSLIARIVYTLVGLSAVYVIATLKKFNA